MRLNMEQIIRNAIKDNKAISKDIMGHIKKMYPKYQKQGMSREMFFLHVKQSLLILEKTMPNIKKKEER